MPVVYHAEPVPAYLVYFGRGTEAEEDLSAVVARWDADGPHLWCVRDHEAWYPSGDCDPDCKCLKAVQAYRAELHLG